MRLFRRIILRRFPGDAELGADLGEYRRIWLRTVVLTLAVSLLPLGVMTLVTFDLYTRGQRSDLQHQVSEDLSNISGFVESIVEERVAALRFLAKENDLASLGTVDLARIYENLRDSFGGFVDLGIIDPEGTQVAYVGPYDLEGDNYFEEEWFHEVSLQDLHVSDVFLGHRQLPHFVVVVRSGDYLLRATMDMVLLNRRVFIPEMGSADDVFLVNQEGVLQTESRLHGNILTRSTISIPSYSPDPRIYERRGDGGALNYQGCRYIPNTPLVLMVVRSLDGTFLEWLDNSREMLVFLAVSAILILVVVFWSTTTTVRHLIAADLHRAQILKGVEHTSKMATIGRLAASVAHEINNPVAVINEKAGLLVDLIQAEEEFPYKEKSLANLQSIMRMVERCGSITHRLLGFTQRLRLRKQAVDLRALGKDVLGFLEKDALHREIAIVFDVAADVPTISSDPGQMEEVFLNLLNNAFAAVDDGGRIELLVRTHGPEHVTITVKDDGCGISTEDLSKIFEPFYSTREEFGTGLGLCITKDLVQKLGGRIEVKSEVGVGSSFVVCLPLNTDAPIK
jgi:two-component system NtrC family sensor kinase